MQTESVLTELNTPVDPNTWYLDTTRLTEAGFTQHSILDETAKPEDNKKFYSFIDELRAAGTPFELITLDPRRGSCALYVKRAE